MPDDLLLSGYYKKEFYKANDDKFLLMEKNMRGRMYITFASGENDIEVKIQQGMVNRKRRREENEEGEKDGEEETERKRCRKVSDEKSERVREGESERVREREIERVSERWIEIESNGRNEYYSEDTNKENENTENIPQGKIRNLSVQKEKLFRKEVGNDRDIRHITNQIVSEGNVLNEHEEVGTKINLNRDESSSSDSDSSSGSSSSSSGSSSNSSSGSNNGSSSSSKSGSEVEENVMNDSDPGSTCSCTGENCEKCKLNNEIKDPNEEIIPAMDDDGLEVVTEDELKNYVHTEKRVFLRMITQEEVDRVNDNFFEKDEKIRAIKVSKMCQSLRFWLAVKFSTYSGWRYNGRNQGKFGNEKVCSIFGVNYNSFKSFMGQDNNARINTFGTLSPSERYYKSQRPYLEKYASNYDDLVKQGLFDKNKKEKKKKND